MILQARSTLPLVKFQACRRQMLLTINIFGLCLLVILSFCLKWVTFQMSFLGSKTVQKQTTTTKDKYRSARAAKKVRQPDAPRSNTIGPFAAGIGEGVRWGVKARQGPTVNVNTGTLSCQEASVFKPVDDEAGMPF